MPSDPTRFAVPPAALRLRLDRESLAHNWRTLNGWSGKAVAGERMPDQLRALLQRMRAEVERNCDYVGPDFAAEARRIHNGESEARGIYGEATDAEAEALDADGVQVARIPWVPRADG